MRATQLLEDNAELALASLARLQATRELGDAQALAAAVAQLRLLASLEASLLLLVEIAAHTPSQSEAVAEATATLQILSDRLEAALAPYHSAGELRQRAGLLELDLREHRRVMLRRIMPLVRRLLPDVVVDSLGAQMQQRVREAHAPLRLSA
jgi:hypothetical protein